MTAVKWTGFLGPSYNMQKIRTSRLLPKHIRIATTHLMESLNLSTVARRTLAGQEAKVAVAGGFVLCFESRGVSFFALSAGPNGYVLYRPYGD